ncbi:ATP-binding protein [Aerosakkonema funiforme]|nr:ATP-binding protein [Aerosakkonema funiforme]
MSLLSLKIYPKIKGSITRETLSKMAVRIALVIIGSTALSYVHLMSTLESQTSRQLEKYIVERGQRESNIFSLVEDSHFVLEQELRRKLDEQANKDVKDEFEVLFQPSKDGVIRNKPEGFDRSRQAGVYIGKNVQLNSEIRQRVMTFYNLVMSYGPAWRGRFQNTYINAPENIVVMYWPEVPWAENAKSDLYIPDEEYFWIADRQHNPSRQTVCTGLYYDKVARDWIISCETPVDIGDRQIATIGNDIILNELLDRTLKDSLPGTYNLIFREDGLLIAHPKKMDEIKNKKGKFDIMQSGDSDLIRIYELVKNLKPGQIVIDNTKTQEYLAVTKINGPNWYFITVFPKSILAGVAFDNARFVLILGGISLLVEIGILLFVIKQQIATPLHKLMAATEQVAVGDFNIQLDTAREDELGRLAHSFNSMAAEVYAREARLKQAQEALQRTDKLKDEFLANTSHELRTPLNGIIGIAESLIEGATGKLPPATISNLVMIASSGRRLANLVNDILDFSKLRHQTIELQLKPVALREIVDLVVTLSQPLLNQKDLQLINDISADLPLVLGDENRLQQIFHNLIGNAIKFTHSGSVNISAQVVSNASGEIQVTISDTGIGIPEDKLERVFESFEQADGSTARIYGGTGLGLAITKQLIELHSGKIWVESVLDRGSRFIFTLPVSQAADVESRGLEIARKYQLASSGIYDSLFSVNDSEKLSTYNAQEIIDRVQINNYEGTPYKILVVDDEPVNRQVLVNHLSLYGYEIIEAASGIEALAILSSSTKPDLILLDVMMPRMTGYEVTRKIRETWQPNELPVLLLTAKDRVADLVVGLEAGANDYLTKPIAKDELFARIKTHCTQSSIFLENSRLYFELQESERRERERAMQLQQYLQQIQQMQLQLIQNEKMAVIGQLIAGIAHEINNPLAFIDGNLTYAENYIKDLIDVLKLYRDNFPDPGGEIAQIIENIELDYLIEDLPTMVLSMKEGTDRIRQISTSLRTFSRADSTSKVPFNINEGLNSTLMILKHKLKANTSRPEIEVIKEYANLPLLVECYPGQLNQVFMNIIANAIDALEEANQGRTFAEIAANPNKIIIQTEVLEEAAVAIRIKDNGCGMPEEVKTRVFDHLFTTKEVGKGTGLGLSISRQIVEEKHGGKLTCVSAPGEGTEFTIQIPI